MRVRIQFEKTDAMRFTSHLDLQRTWERTIRRAQLPLTYSEGFKPRPRITLATALPLGFTSAAEVIEIRLDENLPLDEIIQPIQQSSPPGIVCRQIYEVEDSSPKIPNLVDTAEYRVSIPEQLPDLTSKIEDLLAQDEIIRIRRKKKYDLRTRIQDIRVTESRDDETILWMELGASQELTGRPDEILLELGIDPNDCTIHRSELSFTSL